jgi:hypothetical protein
LKRYAAITFLFLVCFSYSPMVLAQYKTEKEATVPLDYFYINRKGVGFRKFLSKFTFGLSTGYGLTTFKHELGDFQILQNPDAAPIIFQGGASGYSNWFNKVEATPATPLTGSRIFDPAADGELGFKSKAFNIPLKATIHVEFDRYRIGGGYSFEYTRLGDFKPLTHTDEIQSFEPHVSGFFLKKYFGMVGASVYRYNEYLLVIDLQIGGYGLGKNFDKSVIKKGVFLNLGPSIEREMSEYFRLFVRPSYEIKSFSIGMPESSGRITHQFNAFYINVGATYRIPERRRCFLKTCKAQMNHAHGDREYRSRVHPIYKKQNPHYGENYPTLIKYKGKNKYKLNPY